ncbi:DMT family transporter [Gammaproteobacteria bacterium]|nr:DMT family transporter [Gammaproteobacteria bacterium]
MNGPILARASNAGSTLTARFSASPLHGLLLGLGGAGLFSLKSIFIKLAYQEGIGPEALMLLRMLASFPFYAVAAVWSWRALPIESRVQFSEWRLWRMLTVVALLGYFLASLLDFHGLRWISAQSERLVLFTYPIWVALLGWLLLGRRPERREWLAMTVSYLGLVVLFGFERQQSGARPLLGFSLVIAATIAFALYVLWSKALIDRLGSRLFTALAMMIATLGIIAYCLLVPIGVVPMTPRLFALVMALAFVSTVVPSFMISAAIGIIGSQKTAITGMAGPLITSVIAVWALDEAFSLGMALSMLLIASGVLVMLPARRNS